MSQPGSRPPLRALGVILGLLGIAAAAVAGLADVIGIGADPSSFGYRQFAGVALGLALIVVAAALILFGGTPRAED